MNQNLYLYDIWSMQKIYMTFLQPLGAETYAEACQTSNMELFAKIVKGWKPVTIFIKSTIFFTLLKALLKFPYIFEYSRSIWMFSNYYLVTLKPTKLMMSAMWLLIVSVSILMTMSADFVHLKNMQMLAVEASNWNQRIYTLRRRPYIAVFE